MRDPSGLFSRRRFLAHASRLSASYAAYCAATRMMPLAPTSALAAPLAGDPRVADTPLVDKGFAAVRQIGKGLYATISDRTKGMQTRSNGGFIIGRDAALLVEGFQTPQGAAFQMDALRMVAQTPVRAAINTHYHFDHSLGNSFYGANGIAVWAHAKAASRMMETYPRMQAVDRATFLAPWEKRISAAKTANAREHAQSDLEGVAGMFDPVKQFVLSLPNHPLDPATMPMAVDLGGMDVVIETYIGHTDTDIIIRVPDQSVVFTGDLLVNAQYPTNINGYPTPWRATLAKFAAFDKDTIFVPGHGQPCGQEGVALMRDIFDDIANQAEKLHQAGVPIAEAEERYVVPDKWKNFRMFSWGFCIGRTMEQLYAEWGTPTKVLSY
jgi:glyoxylase-like metal-dependent hydrolase (beta-lactamase superfamily II)